MAGWLRAIRAVPWTDIVAAAPMVLGSARKVVSALQTKVQATRTVAPADAAPRPDDPQLRVLHERVADIETDLVAATEIIRNLADQHAQVVSALEALRQKTRVLTWTGALLAAVVVGLLLWLASR